MSSEINPYKLFKLPKGFTLEQLRSSYKKLAIAVHPDKPGGSEYLFQQITSCYRKLVKEFQRKQADKTYIELKDQYTSYVDTQKNERRHNVSISGDSGEQFSGKNFNHAKFNQIFNENRMQDANDHGYGNWMSSSTKHREDIEVKNSMGKYNEDAFHKAFERIKIPKDRSLVKFHEPEALPLSARNVSFSELGVAKIEDFGDQLSSKSLSFSDYRRAHTTTRLIDVDAAMRSRKQFDSIDHLEAEREKISYEMDARTSRLYERRQKDLQRQEKARAEYQRIQDRLYEKQYAMLNKLMLK